MFTKTSISWLKVPYCHEYKLIFRAHYKVHAHLISLINFVSYRIIIIIIYFFENMRVLF